VSETIVGLDIGTSTVRAVIGVFTENGELQITGVGKAPSNGLRNGAIINLEAAMSSVTDAIEAAGSELTPEEQKLEDEELAAKGQVEEALTEELRTWICWYEGNDIGTVEAETEEEAAEKMMTKYPEYQYNNTD
jgi:Tfp pilus assembly PilM family ATPase